MSVLSSATNVHKVKMIADGGTDLGPLHGTAIAAMTFTAINLEDGEEVTITSVAYDGTLDALTVTIDSTEWTALGSGDMIELRGPSSATMAAGNVRPYELLSVIIVK